MLCSLPALLKLMGMVTAVLVPALAIAATTSSAVGVGVTVVSTASTASNNGSPAAKPRAVKAASASVLTSAPLAPATLDASLAARLAAPACGCAPSIRMFIFQLLGPVLTKN